MSISYSGRNCLSDGLLWRHRRSCGAVFGLGSLKSSCFRMRLMATEIAQFDFVLYSGCVRRGVHLCGWGVRLLAGLDQHRRSPEAGGWERTSRNLGCPTNDRRAGLAGALHSRPRRGRRRLTLNASLRHDETSLCSRSSGIRSMKSSSKRTLGSVDRFRSPSHRRPASQT